MEPQHLLTIPGAGTRAGQQRRYLSLWADVRLDPDTQRMEFHLVQAPALSPTTQAAIARALNQWAARTPKLLFYKRLRQELERKATGEGPLNVTTAIANLGKKVQTLDTVNPGTLADRHQTLMNLFLDACDEMGALARAQALVEPLVGYDAHERALRKLAASATRQLVLANPWLSLDGLLNTDHGESWFDLLSVTLKRGVQVVLLWGMDHDSILPDNVQNALETLRKQPHARLLFSPRSSVIHAKIAIRDATAAIVTSYNFLQPPHRRDSLELGLHLTGQEPGQCPQAIADLLDWARGVFPQHEGRVQIQTRVEALGGTLAADPSLPDAPILPDLGPGSHGPEDWAPALTHWGDRWRAISLHLSQASERLASGIQALSAGEHEQALWTALRQASRRLAILSDKISVDVVNDSFVRNLRRRLEEGASCTLVFRTEGATDRRDGPAARVRALAQAHPSSCRLVEARSHAKVLIADDMLAIGSFNFLSYGGQSGHGGRRERAELSLQVHDASLVEKILLVLEEQMPGAFQPLRHREGQRPAGAPIAAPASLQPLLRQLRADNPGHALLEWFASTPTPWLDLESLRHSGIAHHLLDQATASAIARAPWSTDTPHWRAHLAISCWSRGDFIAAAALLPDPVPTQVRLTPGLALLGASIQAKHRAELELETPSDGGLAAANLALALVVVLRQGRFDLLPTLHTLAQQAPKPMRPWPSAVESYQRATRSQPLPLRLLKQSAAHAARQQAIQAAHAAFGNALEQAEQVGFRFPLGKHTWDALRARGGLLGDLRAIYDAANASAMDTLRQQMKDGGQTLENLMDNASRAAGDPHRQIIGEPKRTSCLKRLERAWQAAITWANLVLHAPPSPDETNALGAALKLRDALAPLRDTSLLEADPIASAALRFARSRLKPLLDMEAP